MMKTKCFLPILLFIGIIYANTVMAQEYSLDEIQSATNGLGVFHVTVNNNGKQKTTVIVSVDLAYPPAGYEEHCFSFVTVVPVDGLSSIKIPLLKPLADDFPNYKGVGPELLANSKVRVSLNVGISRPLLKYHPAKYVPDTKFIDVPDTVFYINFDQRYGA